MKAKSWQKAQDRMEKISSANAYVVKREWMGAAIFGASFSARSSFIKYTQETEAKLHEHAQIRPGKAILVFCGNGFGWNISELEDFVDFYHTGLQRADDPFAEMERHAMIGSPALMQNLTGFAALVRTHDAVEPKEWIYPVRGSQFER